MDSRGSARSHNFNELDLCEKKAAYTNSQRCSPKFMRKRVQSTNVVVPIPRKQKMTSPPQSITFISPKKYNQQKTGDIDNTRADKVVSKFELAKQVSPRSSPRNIKQIRKSPKMRESIAYQNRAVSEVEQLRQKVKSQQQVKNKNEELSKRIYELNEKIKILKQQNTCLYRKCGYLNELLSQKNQVIHECSSIIKQKEIIISSLQSDISGFERKIQQHQALIQFLNKSLQSYGATHQISTCTTLTQETEDGEKDSLIQEINKYRLQVDSMASKLRYLQIQQSMYNKLRYEYNTQLKKSEELEIKNRKLSQKVRSMISILSRKQNPFNSPKSRKQLEISFQLSPQSSS